MSRLAAGLVVVAAAVTLWALIWAAPAVMLSGLLAAGIVALIVELSRGVGS